jgi:glutamate-1-semialdehyde 2,1-aminomutase
VTTTLAQRGAGVIAAAEGLFPGGVNSPVRAFRAVGRSPLVLERGRGAYVWDADGRRYLDLIGSWGPSIVGHAHPAVVEAVTRAAMDGFALGATHPLEVELGRLITERMPSMERLRFTASGTEAVMSAVRVARAATHRDLIITFAGAYHGHSDGLLAAAGSGLATQGIPSSAGVPAAVAGLTVVLPWNDADAVTAAFAAYPGRIAAIVAEPVIANAGVLPPHPGFLQHLREAASAAGALLVFDEVITGFRLARGGAQERFGITPDLTTLGKIIGGGMPIGAYGGRADLMGLVAPAGPVYQAGTLSGHPLSMAAGIATLGLLDDAAYAQLERTGEALEAGLRDLLDSRPLAVARAGSLLTLFFRDAPPTNGAEALTSDRDAFAGFFGRMVDRHVLLPPSQFEAWFLSLEHREPEIETIVSAAAAALAQ